MATPDVTATGKDQKDRQRPRRAGELKTAKKDLRVLYRIVRDPVTPWYVPLLMGIILIWAISPVDVFPDIFPILGVIDEAIVFLLFRAAVYRVVPDATIESHSHSVATEGNHRFTARHLIGSVIIVQIVVILAVFLTVGWGIFNVI